MDTTRYEAKEHGRMTDIPVIFIPDPAAVKPESAIAEELAASILRQEFLREIHR